MKTPTISPISSNTNISIIAYVFVEALYTSIRLL